MSGAAQKRVVKEFVYSKFITQEKASRKCVVAPSGKLRYCKCGLNFAGPLLEEEAKLRQ